MSWYSHLQVIVVDGNGILHPRGQFNCFFLRSIRGILYLIHDYLLGFGLACHLGVLLDIPTIGAAKNLFHVDGLERDEAHAEQVSPALFRSDFKALILKG